MNLSRSRRLRPLLATLLFSFVSVSAVAWGQEPPVVLAGATLIDGTGAPARPGHSVVIVSGLIADVFETGSQEPPADATVLDLSGRHVLPGLINGHVHLTAYRGDTEALLRTILYRGVTAVRDLGGDSRTLAVLARDAKLGTIESPAIYFAANLFGPAFAQDPRVRFSSLGMESGTAPWARAVTAETDLPQIIAEAKGTGATGVKLYASLDAELVRQITDEAHRQGLQVWSHATTFPAAPSEIVASGVDGVEHIVLAFTEKAQSLPESLPESWSDGFRNWLPGQTFGSEDPAGEPFSGLYSAMAERQVLFGTTLAVAHRLSRLDQELEPGWPPALWAKVEAWECGAVEAAQAAGVPLVAGTDYDGSVPIQTELELLVGCGLTPLEAITSATLRGAEAIGIERTHGTIELGKVADLVVLGSDPLAEIRNTRDVDIVIKAGRLIEVGPEG